MFCAWGPVHSGKCASWNLKMCISVSPWVGSNSPQSTGKKIKKITNFTPKNILPTPSQHAPASCQHPPYPSHRSTSPIQQWLTAFQFGPVLAPTSILGCFLRATVRHRAIQIAHSIGSSAATERGAWCLGAWLLSSQIPRMSYSSHVSLGALAFLAFPRVQRQPQLTCAVWARTGPNPL